MKEDIATILNTAIGIEKEGAKMYLEFAKKAKDISAKDMFIQLAREEIDHREVFEKFKRTMEVSDSGDVDIPQSEINKIVEKLKSEKGPRGEKATSSEQDALRIALQLEEKSANYYGEKAKEVSNEKLKGLLKALESIEWNHYALIKYELDSVTKTGHWMDYREFTLE